MVAKLRIYKPYTSTPLVGTFVLDDCPITSPEKVVLVYSGSKITFAPETPNAGHAACEVPSITTFDETTGSAVRSLMVRLALSVGVPGKLKLMVKVVVLLATAACVRPSRKVPGPLSALLVTT
ncbi:hypothetical protein D3C87_422610 [compost metagenome]